MFGYDYSRYTQRWRISTDKAGRIESTRDEMTLFEWKRQDEPETRGGVTSDKGRNQPFESTGREKRQMVCKWL